MKVLRSHHIIFVRYRSSGYGVAGIFVATTPPDVRHRFRTCDPAVATTNCASSSAMVVNGVRASVLASASAPARVVGHPGGFHLHHAERQPVGQHLAHRAQTRPVVPFDDGMRFLRRLQRTLGADSAHDRSGVVHHGVEQLGIGLVGERVHVQRAFDPVPVVAARRAVDEVGPQGRVGGWRRNDDRAVCVGIEPTDSLVERKV